MATEVELPALGESVTEGTVSRWLKSVGDTVEVDEPLLEVSTDKVDTEIPSPVAGVLLSINAEEDETVEVGDVLCTVGDEDEADGAGSDDGGSDDEGEDADEDEADEAEAEAEEPEEDDADEDDKDDAEDEPQEKKSSGGGGGGGGTEVELPALGESVTEGTVSRWLKSVGDEVEMDEPLLEVSTDKVDTEIPSPVAGTLMEIRVEEDETVEVGDVLCVVGDGEPSDGGGSDDEEQAEPEGNAEEAAEPEADDEPEDDPVEEDEADDEAPEPTKEEEKPSSDGGSSKSSGDSAPSKPASRATEGDGDDSEAYVTPLVRKLAKQHDVDLSSIEGSGVGGRIRKQDVLDAAKGKGGGSADAAASSGGGKPAPSAPKPADVRGKTEKMSRLRKVIAQRMHESLQVSAQLTTVVEVDVTRIARLRDAEKADFHRREGVKLSFMPFFAKAAIDALKEHASLNASIDMEAGEITYYDHENVAIAVDTEKGLLTPVIKEAGDLSIAGLAKKIADLAERTRTNKVGPDELSGGTFTLTNTGSRGALFDTPIINQPQVAILGTGAVVKRAVVMDDPNLGETIAVRQMVYLALTYDHRLVDGADAARFLSDVKDRLENGNWDV